MSENVAQLPATQQQVGVIADMAGRQGMDPRAFEAVLRHTVVPAQCSKEQFAAFLMVARQYDLNPITKEIYAFPSKGGIQPIVSIDGWMKLMNSHPDMDGLTFEDHKNDEGELEAITARVYRKGRTHPVEVTEYLSECRRDKSEPWAKWPRRMLRHKAAIQAARYAFGFSGIIDPDEYDRFGQQGVQHPEPPSEPQSAPPATGASAPPPPPQEEQGEVMEAEEIDARPAEEVIDEFDTVCSGIMDRGELFEQWEIYKAKPAIQATPMDFNKLEAVRDKHLERMTDDES